MRITSLCSVLLIAFLFFTSCSPSSTQITGSWKNEKAISGKKYKSVFISALTDNLSAKQAVEDAFGKQARFKKITYFKSYEVFGPGYDTQNAATKTDILDRIHKTGAEAILTVSLKQTKSTTRYVPGSSTYYPTTGYGYYGSYYGYYGAVYQEVHQPGYYATDNTYFLECNIYDAATEEILYSAQSHTTNPDNVQSFASEYAATIVDQMKKDGLLSN